MWPASKVYCIRMNSKTFAEQRPWNCCLKPLFNFLLSHNQMLDTLTFNATAAHPQAAGVGF